MAGISKKNIYEVMAGISEEDIYYQCPSNLNILVIDTDIEVLEFIEKTYKDSHQVIICTETSKAVELLLRKEIDIHLIIMELHMPMMDGYEFMQFLNKEEIYVALIVMFFPNTVPCIKKAFELGACYYWLKPLEDFYVRNFWPYMLRHYKKRLNGLKFDKRSDTSGSSECFSDMEVIRKNMNDLKLDEISDTSGSSECFSDMEVVADDTLLKKDDTLHKNDWRVMAAISKKDIYDQCPSNLNILVIDTDIEVLELIERTYKDSHQVIICTETSKAVELLLRKEIDIHLIIMELHMPMMDGYEFMQFLNKEEIYVALIVMFFPNTVPCIKKAFELGACYYWLKPLEDFYVRNFWPYMLRHYKKRLNGLKFDKRSDTSGSSECFSDMEVIRKNMNGLKLDEISDTSDSSECFSDMEDVADDTFHMKDDDTLHQKE